MTGSDRVQQEKENRSVIRPRLSDRRIEKAAPTRAETEQPGRLSAPLLQRLQQTVGNREVQRLLQRRGEGEAGVDEETASAINQERGRGQTLDGGMAARARAAMGHRFDDVTIHADTNADRLSRRLGARAFTTGSDIFFRAGAYDPGSQAGQHLLAHELTHVVQQSGGASPGDGQMTVNNPDDAFEAEADAVADHVMNQTPEQSMQEGGVQRQAQEDEVMCQVEEEEEEMLQMQEEEEEELLA